MVIGEILTRPPSTVTCASTSTAVHACHSPNTSPGSLPTLANTVVPAGMPQVEHPASGWNVNWKLVPSALTEFGDGPAVMLVSNPLIWGGGNGAGGGEGGRDRVTVVRPNQGTSPPTLPSTTATRASTPGRWLWKESLKTCCPFSA